MFKEFREFIARGNVVDLAVGVIIGGAFGAIVKSLVDQVIMPPIGLITGGIDFSQWMRSTVEELGRDASNRNVRIPAGFPFGFIRSTGRRPKLFLIPTLSFRKAVSCRAFTWLATWAAKASWISQSAMSSYLSPCRASRRGMSKRAVASTPSIAIRTKKSRPRA